MTSKRRIGWILFEVVALAIVASLAALALVGSSWSNELRVLLGALGASLAVAMLVHVRRLDDLAHRDPLTGALNRRGLVRVLSRGAAWRALLLVDLDRFKAINDRFGHAAGDEALCAVARVLARHGTVARLGGDELAVLVDHLDAKDAIAAEVRDEGDALRLPLSVSIGEALLRGGDLSSVLERADAAMYAAKHAPAALPPRSPHERRARRHVVELPIRVRTLSGPLALAAVALALVLPSLASAQHQRGGVALHDPPPPPPPGPVRLELLGGSLAPIDSGFTARLIFGDVFFVSAGVGLGTYGEEAAILVRALGGSAGGASLAHDAWSGLFGLHLSAGLRPIPGEGLEISGGYTLLTHDTRFWAETFGAALNVETSGNWIAGSMLLHAYTVELGWTFRLLDHFLFRPAIGFLQVLDAQISLDDTGTSYADQSLDALAAEYTGYAETWGMTPTLSLSIGYVW